MAQTYNIDDLEELEEQALDPDNDNLAAAAAYLQGLFQANGIEFVFMGGYSMALRGSERVTNDIDVAVDATVAQLHNLIRQQERLVVPASRLTASVLRIFVKTGGQWDEDEITPHLVEVDMLIAGGGYGVPRPIRSGIEIISSTLATSTTNSYEFPVLSVNYMLAAKLRAFGRRESDNDYDDIVWLLQNYNQGQPNLWGKLDYDDCVFFIEASRERENISTITLFETALGLL